MWCCYINLYTFVIIYVFIVIHALTCLYSRWYLDNLYFTTLPYFIIIIVDNWYEAQAKTSTILTILCISQHFISWGWGIWVRVCFFVGWSFLFVFVISMLRLPILAGISLLCMYLHLWSLSIRIIAGFCLILWLIVSALLQVSYHILYGSTSHYTSTVYQPLLPVYPKFVSSLSAIQLMGQ